MQPKVALVARHPLPNHSAQHLWGRGVSKQLQGWAPWLLVWLERRVGPAVAAAPVLLRLESTSLAAGSLLLKGRQSDYGL